VVETFVVTFQSVPLVSALMHCVARGCIRFRHAILITWYYLVDYYLVARGKRSRLPRSFWR